MTSAREFRNSKKLWASFLMIIILLLAAALFFRRDILLAMPFSDYTPCHDMSDKDALMIAGRSFVEGSPTEWEADIRRDKAIAEIDIIYTDKASGMQTSVLRIDEECDAKWLKYDPYK